MSLTRMGKAFAGEEDLRMGGLTCSYRARSMRVTHDYMYLYGRSNKTRHEVLCRLVAHASTLHDVDHSRCSHVFCVFQQYGKGNETGGQP